MNLQSIYLNLKNKYPNMDDSDIRRMAWVERDRKIFESQLSKSSSSSSSNAGRKLILKEEVLKDIISINLKSNNIDFEVDLNRIDDKWHFKALLGGDILIHIIFIQKENDLYNVYLFDEEDYDDFPFELIASSSNLIGDYTIINSNFDFITVSDKKDINYCLNYSGDDFFQVAGISASNSDFYPYQLGKSDNKISNSFYSNLTGGVNFEAEFILDKWVLSVNGSEIAEIDGVSPVGTYTNYLSFEGEFNLSIGNCFV